MSFWGTKAVGRLHTVKARNLLPPLVHVQDITNVLWGAYHQQVTSRVFPLLTSLCTLIELMVLTGMEFDGKECLGTGMGV